MKAEKIFLGNVITLDDKKPYAEAVAVKDGLVMYVGSENIARSLADDNTEIVDLKGNSIYPGFIESHCHPLGAGQMLDKEATADFAPGNSNQECLEILAEYIKKHPEKKLYLAFGYMERDEKPTAAMLDIVCPDKPVIATTVDGHSQWLNTAAMKMFHIDEDAVEKYGVDLVHVDENGHPTGYLSEAPVFDIRKQLTISMEDGKSFLLKAQEFFFSKGYTAVYDAGQEIIDKKCIDFYKELVKDGSLKLRTYAGSIIDENCEDIKGAVKKIAESQECNSEYYKVIGVKTFSDGVVEAHTAFLLDEYLDQPGYHGSQRMTDAEKLKELYTEAAKHNLNVHCHTIGDAAVRCNLDAIEEAIKATGKTDLRNALAHLQIVNKEDIKRFGDLNVVAVVPPLWTGKEPSYFQQEVDYVGADRAEAAYPIKSFIDNGATIVFHTDYPVSPVVDVTKSVYTAVKRKVPGSSDECVRKSDEFITRYQALLALTKNVAYLLHEENHLGSLEIGKVANMSVYDSDFLKDDLEKIGNSNLVCTIVDGETVYKA